MSSTLLPNYVRSHRKRLAFTQDDVAFLLGAQSEATISRIEDFSREPSLRHALALEAIYQTPVRELFAGIYEETEREVAQGAQNLMRVRRNLPERHTAIRTQALTALATSGAAISI